jgi:hypothetical protein
MVLPLTVPVRGAEPDVDRLIVPANFPDDSTHVRSNVPVNAPVYDPDHLPLSAPAVAAALVVAAAGVEDVVAAAAVVVAAAGVDELAGPEELLHPAARAKGSATAAASRVRLKCLRMPATMDLPSTGPTTSFAVTSTDRWRSQKSGA